MTTICCMRGLRVIVLLLVSLLSVAGCKKAADPAAEAKTPDDFAVDIVTAGRRSIETTVAAQGTMTAGQGAAAHVATSAPGKLLAVRVREGDHVTAGQILALVDNRPQQAQTRSASSAAIAAEIQARSAQLAAGAAAADQAGGVRLAQLAVQSAKLDRDSAVQNAQSALDAANVDLQKTRAGARPQEIAQADQALNQAKATRDRAATELDRVRFLFEKGIDAKRQLDDAQTAVTVADAAFESARQAANLLRAGARPEDLKASEIRVRQAEQALAQARTSGEAKLTQARAALRQAQGAARNVAVKRQDAAAMQELAAQKQSDLAAARSTAAYGEIRSPLTGVVTRRMLNPGDYADVNTPILDVAEPGALNLVAGLSAQDGAQVRAGMPAHISSTELPDRSFSGVVLNTGPVDPQTNLMTVRLSVSGSGGVLRAGSFATADIVERVDPDAVVVPKQAIVTREGVQVLFVVGQDNKAHLRKITTGPSQNDFVEIVRGLEPGARVIRLGQYEIADGTTVHQAEPKGTAAAASEAGK